MATNNFGNFTFSPTSLLATEERAELCHYVTMFDRADVATMRDRAIGQERIGNLVAATGLRIVADRMEAGMVPAWVQAKAADEAAQAVAYLAAKPRTANEIAHWGALIARAEKVTDRPTFFA